MKVSHTLFDATANKILLWVFAIPGFISTTSPMYIRVESSGNFTSNYGDFYIGVQSTL